MHFSYCKCAKLLNIQIAVCLKWSAYVDILNGGSFSVTVPLVESRLRLHKASHTSEKFFDACIRNRDIETIEHNGDPHDFQYAAITSVDMLPTSLVSYRISSEFRCISISIDLFG